MCAAIKLGLPAIGIEIEEKYCEMAVQRLSQKVLPLFTATSAVHGESSQH
jgi:DNA modification methylase